MVLEGLIWIHLDVKRDPNQLLYLAYSGTTECFNIKLCIKKNPSCLEEHDIRCFNLFLTALPTFPPVYMYIFTICENAPEESCIVLEEEEKADSIICLLGRRYLAGKQNVGGSC